MKTIDAQKAKPEDSKDKMPGAKAQIRDALRNVETETTCIEPDKRFRKVMKDLKKKNFTMQKN